MARQIEIQGSPEMHSIIVEALKQYAYAAFPDSGSPCQMVSRDALLTAADDYARHHQQHGAGIISSRMRAMLKAAIKYYFNVQAQQTRSATERQCELLLEVCRGRLAGQQELEQARQADRDRST